VTATRRPLLVGALATAVIALVATAAVAVGTLGGSAAVPTMMRGGTRPGGSASQSGSSRAEASLPGTVVNVAVTNTGGAMMGGQGNGMMGANGMGLSADRHGSPWDRLIYGGQRWQR